MLTAASLLVAACGGGPDARDGEALMTDLGCFVCHAADGSSPLGPSLVGIWGTEAQLADGETVTVDATYIEESVTSPFAKVVAGYRPTMPGFFLEEDEVSKVVAYVRSLETKS